ncbi:MAG: aspartate/glutamate racemase family protein [Pseudomonadota bacterium]
MIVIINPNSTDAMTQAMLATAQRAVPGLAIEAWTSREGPPAIEGPEDGAASVPPLLDLVDKASQVGARVIIIGCSDDTGLAEARARATCPVIGIGQAAYHLAALAGARFSVVTTLPVSVPILTQNINAYGLSGQLARVRAAGVPVLALEQDAEASALRVFAEIGAAQTEDDIQTVVLGCAGMTHVPARAGPDIKVRLIDGVQAAVQIGALL